MGTDFGDDFAQESKGGFDRFLSDMKNGRYYRAKGKLDSESGEWIDPANQGEGLKATCVQSFDTSAQRDAVLSELRLHRIPCQPATSPIDKAPALVYYQEDTAKIQEVAERSIGKGGVVKEELGADEPHFTPSEIENAVVDLDRGTAIVGCNKGDWRMGIKEWEKLRDDMNVCARTGTVTEYSSMTASEWSRKAYACRPATDRQREFIAELHERGVISSEELAEFDNYPTVMSANSLLNRHKDSAGYLDLRGGKKGKEADADLPRLEKEAAEARAASEKLASEKTGGMREKTRTMPDPAR